MDRAKLAMLLVNHAVKKIYVPRVLYLKQLQVTATVRQDIIFLVILVMIYVPNAIKNVKLALNLISVLVV
jgi:hypothetical protein